MKTISDLAHVLGICLVAAILTGCGGWQAASPAVERLTSLAPMHPLTSSGESLFTASKAERMAKTRCRA